MPAKKKTTKDVIAEKFGIVEKPAELPKRPYSPMILYNIEQRTPEWEQARSGKITGTKTKGLMGKTRSEWINLLTAEQLSVWSMDETDMQRGNRLEPEALAHFTEKTGIEVTKMGMVARADNPLIASSPDGMIYDKNAMSLDNKVGAFKGGLEIKCLSGKRHVQAIIDKLDYIEGKLSSQWEIIPTDYQPQSLQYFVTNDDMDTLYFAFYSEEIGEATMVVAVVQRSEILAEIERARAIEESAIVEVGLQVKRIRELDFSGTEKLYK